MIKLPKPLYAFVFLASAQSAYANQWHKVLSDDNRSTWGSWRAEHQCQPGETTASFKLRVEAYQVRGDDTGVNGLQFGCHPFPNKNTQSLPVAQGYLKQDGRWGVWEERFNGCRGKDAAVGLRVTYLPSQGVHRGDYEVIGTYGRSNTPIKKYPPKGFSSSGEWADDVGIFDVDLVCRNFSKKFQNKKSYIDTPNSLKRAEFKINPRHNARIVERLCPVGQFMSGFAAKIEPFQGSKKREDDTAVTNLKILCTKFY